MPAPEPSGHAQPRGRGRLAAGEVLVLRDSGHVGVSDDRGSGLCLCQPEFHGAGVLLDMYHLYYVSWIRSDVSVKDKGAVLTV